MRRGDEYETGVVTPHGHYTYLRTDQGLKGASHTYAWFGDMTFGFLPGTDDELEQGTLLKDHGEAGYSIFADDHIGAGTSSETLFTFFHMKILSALRFRSFLSPTKEDIHVRRRIGLCGVHGQR